MSENFSKKEIKENKQSKLHELYKHVKYFLTIHGTELDFKRRSDYEHMIEKSSGVIVTSDSNEQIINDRFHKQTYNCKIPFFDTYAENNAVKNKIVCLSRFYPGK